MGITQILSTIIQMYIYVIFAYVIMTWLISFNVISLRTKIWAQVWNVLSSLTNPVFSYIRKFVPPMGGLDITPVIVLLVLTIIQRML